MKRVLAVRQDNNGDVLLAGPAIRAIAASARVTLLCGPRGVAAARALPGVDRVIVFEAPWIDPEPKPVDTQAILGLVADLRARVFDEAIVFTSFHQSALPLALLLRMAGIAKVGAISDDYPGSLLDVRHRSDDNVHEVQRALSLAQAMGYALPQGDDGALRMECSEKISLPFDRYVVVHPGSTAPARAWFPERNRDLVTRLDALRFNIVVTGAAEESALTSYVAGGAPRAIDLGGMTTFAQYAGVLHDAQAVVCGNTVAAHVASAVGSPVVSIFAPTIPALRFHPWMTRYIMLGDQHAPCAGCRARSCPVEGQPCLDVVGVADAVDAVIALTRPQAEVA